MLDKRCLGTVGVFSNKSTEPILRLLGQARSPKGLTQDAPHLIAKSLFLRMRLQRRKTFFDRRHCTPLLVDQLIFFLTV